MFYFDYNASKFTAVYRQKRPTGDDSKDDFCQGIHRLLNIESVSTTKTIPIFICDKEPMQDDVRSILDIVKQKFPNKFEKVRKALSDIEEQQYYKVQQLT